MSHVLSCVGVNFSALHTCVRLGILRKVRKLARDYGGRGGGLRKGKMEYSDIKREGRTMEQE